MRVNLIYHTPNAEDLLIFTKNTRLGMTPEGLEAIRSWPGEKKLQELLYMSTTLPSSWEFADLIFSIEDVTRAFTHQLVRTRTASYAQQAMRVAEMTGFGYDTGPSIIEEPSLRKIYDQTMDTIQHDYNELLARGAQPQDARGILPTNIHTNIVAKYNLRNFAELVRKRSSGRVQGEYAEFIQSATKLVLGVWPWAHMFLNSQKTQAMARLTEYLKEELEAETDTGTPMTETYAWKLLKDLDLIRDML